MLLLNANSGKEMEYSSLNASLLKLNPQIRISNQALSKYFHKESSRDLIKEIFEYILQHHQKTSILDISEVNIDSLKKYNKILIQDSTVCKLNDKLKDKYKGTGGSGSQSSVKIDLIYEFKACKILQVNILSGNQPDYNSAETIFKVAEKGDLILRDLGYFKIDQLRKFNKNEIYFISRLVSTVKVYSNEHATSPMNIGEVLSKNFKYSPVVDLIVYIGPNREKFRLVACKVSNETCNQNLRKAHLKAKMQGRTASNNILKLCSYVIIITNISKEDEAAETILKLMRIRWHIELIFKTWKSQFKLQKSLIGQKNTKIECSMYIVLIIAILSMNVSNLLKRAGLDKIGDEVSLEKLSKWLMNNNGFFKILFKSTGSVLNELKCDMRNIKMQKRKRKTTLSNLNMECNYV